MLAPWPDREPARLDEESENEIEWLKQIIVGIRTIRSESNIPPATELPVFVGNATDLDRERFKRNEAYLGRLAKVSAITILTGDEQPPVSLMALCGDLEMRVPMAGVIDIEAELARLDKEMARQEAGHSEARWQTGQPRLYRARPGRHRCCRTPKKRASRNCTGHPDSPTRSN